VEGLLRIIGNMSRILLPLLLLSLLFAVPGFAQSDSADLKIEFEFAPEEHLTGTYFGTWTRITNNGPATAHGLAITASAPGANAIDFYQTSTHCKASTCSTTFGDLAPGAYVEFSVAFGLAAPVETTIPLTVRVSSSEPDPNQADNVVEQDQLFIVLPEIGAEVQGDNNRLEPEMPADVTFGISNRGQAAALGTTADLTLPNGSVVLSVTPPPGVTCTSTNATVHCETGTLQVNARATIRVTVRTPPVYDGGAFALTARVAATNRILASRSLSATTSWYFAPLFVVNNNADSGPGSLRQAIIDGNARCVASQCRVGFRIPATDVVTIHLATALPAVTGNLGIDGISEKYFVGQKDLAHPLIQLDGSLVAAGNALELRGEGSGVSGLAIGNFPGIGVMLVVQERQSYVRFITDNFIGTDATGTIAMPNQRGVMVLGNRYGYLTRNVISGNRLSGVWILGGYQINIDSNRIGVAADGVTPLPNGASGIYVGEGSDRSWISRNTIAYNREFGIAVHPSVRQMDASNNSIFGNGNFGIDYGLDLATPNVEVDAGRQPNTPVLFSATYDAARKVTTIEGELHSFEAAAPLGNRFRISFYSNDSARAQAQTRLVDALVSGIGHFSINVNGDLRGKYITAITLRYRKGDEGTLEEYAISEETSEISAPVVVQ
jgi:parallel beta-helix repeat protein